MTDHAVNQLIDRVQALEKRLDALEATQAAQVAEAVAPAGKTKKRK